MHRIILHALSHDLCTGPVMLKKQFCFCSMNMMVLVLAYMIVVLVATGVHGGDPGAGVHGGGPGTGVHGGGDSRVAN